MFFPWKSPIISHVLLVITRCFTVSGKHFRESWQKKNSRGFSCYTFLMGWARIFELCDLLGAGFHRVLMSISWVRCNNLAGLIISRFKNVLIAEVIGTKIQHQSNIYSLLYFLCYIQMLYIFFSLVTANVHYLLNIFC